MGVVRKCDHVNVTPMLAQWAREQKDYGGRNENCVWA